ncbi:hypothetical protein ACQKPX_07245 [Photobacterium sp. DNB23_23_1]
MLVFIVWLLTEEIAMGQRFSEDTKKQCVRDFIVMDGELSKAAFARQVGFAESTVRGWITLYGKEVERGIALEKKINQARANVYEQTTCC